MNKAAILAWRLFTAAVVSTVVMIVIMTFGRTAGESLGVKATHNVVEVIAAFMTGGIITLLYRDRFDNVEKEEGRGR